MLWFVLPFYPIEFFLCFERTGYDMWTERLTLHVHCCIMRIEVSLPHRGPNQTFHLKRQPSRYARLHGAVAQTRKRNTNPSG